MREPKAAFEIVVATESDIDGILDVFAVVAAEERYIATELPVDRTARGAGIASTISRPDALYLIARSGETIIGQLGLYSMWPGLLGLGMAVVKDWRSQGVGEALLVHAIEWARQYPRTRSASKFSRITWQRLPSMRSTDSLGRVCSVDISVVRVARYGTLCRWVSSCRESYSLDPLSQRLIYPMDLASPRHQACFA